MSYLHPDQGSRFLSKPYGIHWKGWFTNTLILQQCGWNLAVNFEALYNRYSLLMKHDQLSLYAYTNSITLYDNPFYKHIDLADAPCFEVYGVAKSLYSLTVPSLDFSKYVEIDATPQYTTSKINRIEDCNIFALARNKDKEIFLDKADMSVVDYLEKIVELQKPKQAEIRQKILKENEKSKIQLISNIYSIEEAA